MPERKALANNTKTKRYELKETQLDFALNCGLCVDEISNIETENTDPKLSTMQSIASYLGITVSDLLKS